MILVTGAAGKTGRAVIRALAARGADVRALIHRPERAEALLAHGAREVAVGDLLDGGAVREAMAGVRAVYHICPNVHADEVEIGANVVEAARDAGVEHLVYHSVLHPQVEAMPHHWLKMRVEERLFGSGLEYTILQPCPYSQNVLGQWERIVNEGVYAVPYSVDARLSLVDLEDVAAVAAVVLTQPGHVGATYELAGPEAPTQVQVAGTLGRVLGRDVEARQITREDWVRQVHATGMGDYAVAVLLQMFRYYDRHGLWGNPNVLAWLLSRPPATFEEFVTRTVTTDL
ncbi:MAG TPA: NmrA family NAD(P)-binding protein [Anaerolineae bacterium]|nr:NmrA family NAD(P)-binding protein [Anaerolineae bacterium]